MADSLDATFRPLLEAVAFAARAHRSQQRKDGKTPYVSHVFRVCLVVRHVFGIDDPAVLTAAALHDTVEDTTTDFDDLQEEFGAEVAGWVATLSKDKRLPEKERETASAAALAVAPWQVKACKLADIFDNVLDSRHMSAEQRARSLRNAHRYLTALQHDLPEAVRRPWDFVARLVAETEGGATGEKLFV
jgi:guanosine-3',5'-bis(diphosphate) 3'-pyrophosphohydrolase